MNHWQLCDTVFPHFVQGIHHQSLLFNSLGVGSHDLRGLHLLGIGVFHQHPTQISIGDDAQQLSFLHHHRGTQAFVGHLDDDTSKAIVRPDFWALVPNIQVFHAEIKLFAQGTSRVELSEILRGETSTPH